MDKTSALDREWRPDILGDGFEMRYMRHPDDYSGEVRSAVIRHKSADTTDKAVLYVHGFSDYFFQKEMAEMFADNGYDFYAVDLRRYGRSLLPGQKMFRIRDLREYFADIESAIAVMQTDGIKRIALLGHSTGGLTTSLYMAESPSPLVKALILNSPFLDWNLPAPLKKLAIPVISLVGALLPNIPVYQKPDKAYADSLKGWDYKREWKPDTLPNPDTGWVRAITTAHSRLRHSEVSVPVLLMHSAESVRAGDNKEKYSRADAILDVESISRYGKCLGKDVTEVSFEGGLHDLALSSEPIRRRVYATMLEWLAAKGL